MADSIFALDPDNHLIEMKQMEYHSEDFFQSILANHPSLLGLGGGEDGSLLLICREASVPDEEAGSGRWSLDHLFLDRLGVPVLVEVKRSSDTRARREVVAQMLDYAANGIAYWPIEEIVDSFRESTAKAGESADAVLDAFLGGGGAEEYWRQVESNLRSGRIRMVFVADRIPKELRRIVEFLNEQMRPAEMLAIEVAQYVSAEGFRTLVPRLVGATERAATAKAVSGPKVALSLDEWLDALESSAGSDAKEAASSLLEWFADAGFDTGVTDSTDAASVSLPLAGGKRAWPIFLRRSSARLEFALQYLQSTPAFETEAARQKLLDSLTSLAVPFRSTGKLTGWPSLALADAVSPSVLPDLKTIALGVKAALSCE